ncbi:MAG TPA: pyridoxine 5'-phosphate synthase, partial [Cyclobacteriaceae bacterium]
MARLSININKFATLRNSRGGNNPDVLVVAADCERFGAEGITVHPRPDERHIRHVDVIALKDVVTTEFNVEGYPDQRYLGLIRQVRPAQATLVPDAPDAITSNSGWDTIRHADFLRDIVREIKSLGIRVSLFVDPVPRMVEAAAEAGSDRI